MTDGAHSPPPDLKYLSILPPYQPQTQDALLLDVRTDAARVANGVAELRRGALGKGAAVPPVRVRGALQCKMGPT